jgi:hypothetical protein
MKGCVAGTDKVLAGSFGGHDVDNAGGKWRVEGEALERKALGLDSARQHGHFFVLNVDALHLHTRNKLKLQELYKKIVLNELEDLQIKHC